MKKLVIILLAMLTVSPAFADGGRGGGGGNWGGYGHGGGWGGGWIFPALIGGAIVYDLSQPPTVIQPQTIYIQPTPAYAPMPATQQYWYFCAAANAYYPYVASCPGGWQAVPASPPAPAYAPPAR